MFDDNLQKALSELDSNVQNRTRLPRNWVAFFGVAIIAAGLFGGWYYTQSLPQISEKQLSHLIIVAARSTDNDPLRVLGEVERHVGKKMADFSKLERVDALTFLMDHIELHTDQETLIFY